MGFMDFFKKKNSGNVAEDRLKLLLISDRADCSPDVMENIKNDIIQVISKYMKLMRKGLIFRLPRPNQMVTTELFRHCLQIFRLRI